MISDAAKLAELYRKVIVTQAAAPVGRDRAIEATHRAARNNPLCGDDIEVLLRIDNGIIADAAFRGQACAICLASASLLCGHLPGQPASAVTETLVTFSAALHGAAADCPAYLQPMLAVHEFPARIACAILPWETAREAVDG